MEQKELFYETPEVEVIEVEVEKGFEGSNGSTSPYVPASPW